MNHIMETYGRLPVSFVSGAGSYLTDTSGKQYLDALSGIAVCGLGHAHPKVSEAIKQQAATLVHTSNLYGIPLQERLAQRLCALSGMDKVFFCNSGAEANEAAIKIGRLYGHNRQINNPTIIVADDSFHGRTMATLSATGNAKVRAGFGPLVSGFIRVPFNDLGAIEHIAENDEEVVAIMVEPVLGEGGIIIPNNNYLAELRQICDKNKWLLILDEVQTGNGRTGTFFAYQQESILPDIVTTAKGLGNGFPIGACIAKGVASEILIPGKHGSTFGGNPLACAAANAVLDTLAEDDLMNRARDLGNHIVSGLKTALSGNNRVVDIRGKGLMIAVEMDTPCPNLVTTALENGILINVARDNVVRLLPPLTLRDDEADHLIAKVAHVVRSLV
ncbi:MAG: aspartate aminotransferase family protein [Gammaproteobacteria bacterium]|nr:aspartate aminotransferase family protein [Gammaproteobacteria bacterium]